MKIAFKGIYKSLSDFESEELTGLCIITGKNGTGKSQLIAAINEVYNSPSNPRSFSVAISPVPTKVNVSDLVYRGNQPVTAAFILPKLEVYFSRLMQLTPPIKEFYALCYEKGISVKTVVDFRIYDLTTQLGIKKTKEFLLHFLTSVQGNGGFAALSEEMLLTRFKNFIRNDFQFFDILLLIKEYKAKIFQQIDRNDFLTTPIPARYVDQSDLFQSQIEVVFYTYLKRAANNDYLFYRKGKFGEDNISVDSHDFEQSFPPPWKIMNRILLDNNIGLQVNEFMIRDFSEGISVEVKFLKGHGKEYISFASLSSGEQVIIGLIIKLFTKEYYEGDLQFPGLIVLDEPDAYLHPEMSKLLIDVLFKSFVRELGIQIIMSTHSPSTIALSPENSIYEMANLPVCSLKNISKDAALKILTDNIPTLSIDYKNHRQVFVESPTDVIYFQNLYNKLNEEMLLDYKLYFISNEKGDGNAVWVADIVEKLRKSGLDKTFGIIDWDNKNKSSVAVKVHGEQKRYTIENYLLDAVYIVVLFLEMQGAHEVKKDLAISDFFNHYNFALEPSERLQELWDWLIRKMGDEFGVLKKENMVPVKYYNGKEVMVPSWYLTMKGHELVVKLGTIFPSIKASDDNKNLDKRLSVIMAKCYPLIPVESVVLIQTLCTKQ